MCVGIQIGATTAPADVGTIAAEAERLGYCEIWLAEDYFELGGIASVAQVLAATAEIPVGLGVVAAPARHPAVTAMEFATIAGASPGRFMAGIGHGSPVWVRQMGLWPVSPLGSLREATSAIRRLLDGEEVTGEGPTFTFNRVRLTHPPTPHVPLYFGVHGPASLRLSGELADGTLLGWFSSPGYVRWARERIDEGRARAGRVDSHELAVLCLSSVDDADPEAARRQLADWAAPMLVGMVGSPGLDPAVTGVEVPALDDQALVDLIGEFVAAGDIPQCADTIDRLLNAGADRVVLVPNPAGRLSTADMVQQIQAGSALVGRGGAG